MIHPPKKPQPDGFSLETFAPSLDGEAGESLGKHLEEARGLNYAGMSPVESAIALMIFYRLWDDEPEDMTAEELASMRAKWETEFLPHLNEPHCGDCTNVAMTCVRCYVEQVIEDAKRITLAMS